VIPQLRGWYERYEKDGFTIVGVHSPEFSWEKPYGSVVDATKKLGVRYPVVQDNNLDTWNAYGNQYWPAEYVIDAKGRVRYTHFGEGGYAHNEVIVRRLLAEAGHAPKAGMAHAHGLSATFDTTPETYLGTERTPHPPGYLAFIGPWSRTAESAEAGVGATLRLRFTARMWSLA